MSRTHHPGALKVDSLRSSGSGNIRLVRLALAAAFVGGLLSVGLATSATAVTKLNVHAKPGSTWSFIASNNTCLEAVTFSRTWTPYGPHGDRGTFVADRYSDKGNYGQTPTIIDMLWTAGIHVHWTFAGQWKHGAFSGVFNSATGAPQGNYYLVKGFRSDC